MKSSPEIERRGIRHLAANLRRGGLVLLLTLPWFMDHGWAGVSIFLKLDNPNIKGESLDSNHKGEIDILSMSFGGSNSGTTHMGDFGDLGKANITDITLFKYADKSTPELLRRIMTGQHIGEARIAFVESDTKGNEKPVMIFSLNNIIVTSHTSGGSGGEDRLTESISLNFEEFTYQTFSYSETGAESDSPSMNWNISENTGGEGGGTGGGGGGVTNTSPTITAIANQTTNEDTPKTAPFTIGDTQTAAGALILSRSSTNPFVVPVEGISFGGSGTSRNVTVNPAANASGSATVTVTVTDGGGLSASRSFVVTVNPVNDPPAIQTPENQITNLDTPLTLTLNVSDIDTAAENISITPTSGNPTLIPASNITFSGSGSSTQMTLTPVAGASGNSLITLTANDGSLDSQPASFTLTVNAAATGPTDIQLSPLIIAEQSPAETVVGSLTATDPDDGNNVSFSLIDSAGGRFKLGGTGLSQIRVDNSNLIDFETTTTHSITIRATDPASNIFDKAFTITVSNVNDAPIITTPAVPDFNIESTTAVTGLGISDQDSGTSDITVTFEVGSGILILDASGALAGKVTGSPSNLISVTASVAEINATLAAGGLTFSSAGLDPGNISLSIQANDLGNIGPGGPQSSSGSVNIALVDPPFNQWRRLKFNTAQLADPEISGLLADADKDGVGNLLEYGVGSNPLDPSEGPGLIEYTREETEGVVYPAVRFNRLKPGSDPALRIELQIATDDFNWRDNPEDTVQVSSTGLDANRDTVVLRSTLPRNDHSRQMMRLRFTLEP